MKESKFKQTTQTFRRNQMTETARLQEELRNRTYHPEPGKKFPINERGHARFITSNTMRDKTVNHVICDEVLTPAIAKYLIYDNSASQKHKGVDHYRRRLEIHLKEYYAREKTNEGYILLVDFSGYYASIPHDKCLRMVEEFLEKSGTDAETKEITMWLLREIFKTFEIDVSRFSDEEIQYIESHKINPMMNYGVPKSLLTGEKFLRKGVDIGTQPSQNFGIMYPYRIDNLAKIVYGIKGYGRYTDDLRAIDRNREYLEKLLQDIERTAEEYGLLINRKKTRICKLSQGFKHLQIKYKLQEDGKVHTRMVSKGITRERRKLKAYKRLLDVGRIDYATIENAFKSWIGGHYKLMSRQQIYAMGTLYYKLFGRRPKWKKGHSRLLWMMAHKSKTWSRTVITTSQTKSSRQRISPESLAG